jgi:hypothetical protein
MAVAPTVNAGNFSSTGTQVSGTIVPDNTGALLCAIYVNALTPFTDTTTVSGCGLTWAKVKTVMNATSLEILTIFVGYGGTPASGTITMTMSVGVNVVGKYAIVQQTGQDMSANPVGYSNSNSGIAASGTVAMALANVTAGRRMFSFWGHRIAEVTAPDSTGLTWVEIHDTTTTLTGFEIQYVDGLDETASASWATSSSWLGIALELKAALLTGFQSNVLDAIDNTPTYDNWGTPSAGGEARAICRAGVAWNIIGASANATERSKSKLGGLVG